MSDEQCSLPGVQEVVARAVPAWWPTAASIDGSRPCARMTNTNGEIAPLALNSVLLYST